MSIFSMLRRGRQAAKHQSTKQPQEPNPEQPKPRYRHIPKHAAIDALSSGPPSFRESDRPKIQEHNRIRSSLTANGIGMTGTGSLSPLHVHTPRTGSSLSFVSYPSPAATPIVRDSSSSSASSSQDESSSSSLRSAPRRKVARRASDNSMGAGRTGNFRPTSFALSPPPGATASSMNYGAGHVTVPTHFDRRSMTTAGPSNIGSRAETAQWGSASPGYSGRRTPQELEAEPVTVPAYRSAVKERRRRSTIISGLPMEFDDVSLLQPAQELVVPVEMVGGGMKGKGMWSMRGSRRTVVEV